MELIIAEHSKTSLNTLNEYGRRDDDRGFLDSLKTLPGALALIIMLGGFVGIASLFLYLQDTAEKPIQALAELEREFQSIPPPPNAVGSNYFGSHKMQHALVSEHFNTTLTFDQVRGYYDSQLEKHGWRLVSEKPSYDWWRDFGGKVVDYRKGDYVAELYYPGKDSGAGYDYALSISWGMK